MPVRLDAGAADFPARFAALLAAKRETAEDVEATVRSIIAEVRERGDAALFELTSRFDRHTLARETVRVSAAEIRAAERSCSEEVLAALGLARDRIDSGREVSPLVQADGAVHIDTTAYTLDEVIDHVVALVEALEPVGSPA